MRCARYRILDRMVEGQVGQFGAVTWNEHVKQRARVSNVVCCHCVGILVVSRVEFFVVLSRVADLVELVQV